MEYCKTPSVFFALPHASPSVVFPVMLFVRPTAAHCHLLLTLLFIGKSKRQKAAQPQKQKGSPGKTTPSYINIMRYYRNSLPQAQHRLFYNRTMLNSPTPTHTNTPDHPPLIQSGTNSPSFTC